MTKRGRPKKFPESKRQFAFRCSEMQADIIGKCYSRYLQEVDAEATFNEFLLLMIFKGAEVEFKTKKTDI